MNSQVLQLTKPTTNLEIAYYLIQQKTIYGIYLNRYAEGFEPTLAQALGFPEPEIEIAWAQAVALTQAEWSDLDLAQDPPLWLWILTLAFFFVTVGIPALWLVSPNQGVGYVEGASYFDFEIRTTTTKFLRIGK
jgi:hypothetical protein